MVVAAVGLALSWLQVEAIEYEMLEVVLPRPKSGFSNCVDINDSNVAIAMSGGERMEVTGGVGSVSSWIWKDEISERIKGVADHVIVKQIDVDGTISALVPILTQGMNDWHPAYIRDGKAYMSPLSSPYIDYLKPYDHNGGLAGTTMSTSSGTVFIPDGSQTVTVHAPPKRSGPGTTPPSSGSVTVPKYAAQEVTAVSIFGGVDRNGAWSSEPVPERLVTLSNRRGTQITRVHSLDTIGRPMKTNVWEWKTVNGNPSISYLWDMSKDVLAQDYLDATAHVLNLNDQGWAAYTIITDKSFIHRETGKPIPLWGGFLATEAGRIRIDDFGGYHCFPFGLNEAGEVAGSSSTKGGAMRGFLWKRGVTHDLNNVTFDRHGWTISSGNAINKNRWIAATAIKGNRYAAFVLKPLKPGSIRRVARIASGAVHDGVLSAKVAG